MGSDWKKPQLKYGRQAVDYTLLDHVGVIGLRKEEADNNNHQRGSLGSRASSVMQDESRHGLSTLKRGKLNRLMIATKSSPVSAPTIQEEEDEPEPLEDNTTEAKGMMVEKEE